MPVAVFALLLVLSAAIHPGCYPKNWSGAPGAYLELDDTPFDIGPYVVFMDPTRTAIVIQHALPAPPVVDWWEAQKENAKIHTTAAHRENELWVAVLEPLPKHQAIAYRVRTGQGITGPFIFRSGRPRGTRFRFAAFGDTRTGHQVHRALIEAMAREKVDFTIHSGDLVEFGGIEDQWRLFFQIEAPLIAQGPLFAAVGNHDQSPRRNFRRFFLSNRWAGDKRYYAHDWGDVRVVIVDSEIELRPGSRQHDFLRDKLAEGRDQDLIMVLSMHYPPYSSGFHGSTPEVRDAISQLAARYGVELVLAGHDHNYERTKKIDGVTYIVAASGGANIRRITPSTFSEVLRTEPHFVIFDVERDSLVGRTVNLMGNTFDAFVIGKNPPQSGSPAKPSPGPAP